ncbi:GFA family protein [Novosphingobium tardum]|uniref:GFA family protein n=1 Tax=Novosphingobium tardum TaxID=1538021 RepID=A0ABV8RQJ9_9SPHN
MANETHWARCQCGRLGAEARSDTRPQVVACHCLACQRRTGAPLGVIAYYPAGDVTISGEAQRYSRTTDSGAAFTNAFCATCGSTVAIETAKEPPMIGIPVGAFADPGFAPPERSVWEESRHAWVTLPADIPHFLQGRIAPKAQP